MRYIQPLPNKLNRAASIAPIGWGGAAGAGS